MATLPPFISGPPAYTTLAPGYPQAAVVPTISYPQYATSTAGGYIQPTALYPTRYVQPQPVQVVYPYPVQYQQQVVMPGYAAAFPAPYIPAPPPGYRLVAPTAQWPGWRAVPHSERWGGEWFWRKKVRWLF